MSCLIFLAGIYECCSSPMTVLIKCSVMTVYTCNFELSLVCIYLLYVYMYIQVKFYQRFQNLLPGIIKTVSLYYESSEKCAKVPRNRPLPFIIFILVIFIFEPSTRAGGNITSISE